MVLESTMVCVDNSDYMRNGDFPPSRIHAQQDAVYVLSRSIFQSHPENKVGLLALVNQKVLVNLTNDIGRLYSHLNLLQPNGSIDLYRGIKTAHLVLKHREAKNHKTRIVVFIASPVTNEDNKLTDLAKQLKKEKVHVDIVSFGEEQINADKLGAFVSILNGKEGTGNHLITVPEGHNVSDTLLGSTIIENAGALLDRVPVGFEDMEDPELAMALFLSLQEEEARMNTVHVITPERSESQVEVDKQNVDDVNDFSELTDIQQLMYALKISMGEETFFEMINDPDFVENLLHNMPELNSQSTDISEAINKLLEDKKSKQDESDNK